MTIIVIHNKYVYHSITRLWHNAIQLFNEFMPLQKGYFIMNQKSIILPDFLYGRENRQHLKGCQRTLHQPACHQQIHPEARGKRRTANFSGAVHAASVLTEEGRTALRPCQESPLRRSRSAKNRLARFHRAWGRPLKDRCQFATLCKYMLLPYLKGIHQAESAYQRSPSHCQSTNDTLKLLEDNKIDIGLIGKPDNA